MNTLFLSPRFSGDSIILQQAALESGWKIERAFKWAEPEQKDYGHIVVYGETMFARFMEEHLAFRLLDPPHDWLTTLPEDVLKREVKHMTIGEARAISRSVFIKPVDDKTFRAGVIKNSSEIPAHLEDTEFVLVAEPVKWNVELRFFLLNGKVLTGSVYSRNGELNDDPVSEADHATALAFAEKHANNLPAGVVVDVGQIDGRGWAIVEANPAWGSGLYNCDPMKALEAIAASCVNK